MKSSKYWISKLGLEKHPEGGYYKETYRAEELLDHRALPKRYSGNRCFATSIYYLLNEQEYSSFHRLQTDETWHFYLGTTMELLVIDLDGQLNQYLLGTDFDRGERLQITIPKNLWFAARMQNTKGYALVGCTMSPGFHFDDFELADQTSLIKQYSQHENLIRQLTVK